MIRAMKDRDREATSVFRTALSAIDNAEAVAVESESERGGAIESAVVGAGRSDVPRRDLSEQEMIEIVTAEADERRAAAELIEPTHPDESSRLRREAAMLSTLIHELEARLA